MKETPVVKNMLHVFSRSSARLESWRRRPKAHRRSRRRVLLCGLSTCTVVSFGELRRTVRQSGRDSGGRTPQLLRHVRKEQRNSLHRGSRSSWAWVFPADVDCSGSSVEYACADWLPRRRDQIPWTGECGASGRRYCAKLRALSSALRRSSAMQRGHLDRQSASVLPKGQDGAQSHAQQWLHQLPAWTSRQTVTRPS